MRTSANGDGSSSLAASLTAGAVAGVPALRMLRGARAAATAFEDRTVLVTGASRGLGFAMARRFAELGADLVICGRDAETLETAAHRLRVEGPGSVEAVPADVSRQEDVDRLVQRALDAFGAIDVLVNNAGVVQVGPLEAQTQEDFAEAMDVMFWGVLRPVLAVLPHMRDRGEGRIATVTSIGGRISMPHLLPYCAAKFAAVGLSEGLRAELAPHGISVTTVVPGLMRTGSHLQALFKSRHREEFAWFSLASSLPVVSMDADRAARRIVEAIAVRRAEIVLTPQAKALVRIHGLAPATTARALSLVSRLLPSPDGIGTDRRAGVDSRGGVPDPLIALGDRAAEDLQLHAG
ncbi:MAG: SDR family NAD(P)-dependent oxidoreductase [Actinomycetota bacterium]